MSSKPGTSTQLPLPTGHDEFLTPRQLAAELKLGESTVYRALEAGRLPGRKVCGRWRTLRSQLVEFVRDGETRTRRDGARVPARSTPRRSGGFRARAAELGSGRSG